MASLNITGFLCEAFQMIVYSNLKYFYGLIASSPNTPCGCTPNYKKSVWAQYVSLEILQTKPQINVTSEHNVWFVLGYT